MLDRWFSFFTEKPMTEGEKRALAEQILTKATEELGKSSVEVVFDEEGWGTYSCRTTNGGIIFDVTFFKGGLDPDDDFIYKEFLAVKANYGGKINYVHVDPLGDDHHFDIGSGRKKEIAFFVNQFLGSSVDLLHNRERRGEIAHLNPRLFES